MDSDIKSTRLTGTGTVYASRGRLRAVFIQDGASAGTLTLRDGGGSGTILCVLDTPGDATGYQDLTLPGRGIQFKTDIHATLSNITAVTFFYEG